MKKIGQFIYPWGNGHFSRMMRLNDSLNEIIDDDLEVHFFSKGEILEKLYKRFPTKKENIHEILMPTPIDGKMGPSVSLSMLNLLVPVSDNQPLVTQISSYLKKENLPSQVVMSSDEVLDSIPWEEQPLLEISKRIPEEDDMVSVTSAAVGVAETGTLAMFSGPDHPSTLNFLPETHVVVLPKDRVAKNYEDVWDMIRNNSAMEDLNEKKEMPRTVNFITGPSHSGDIEQTLLLGAHGPRRLHIILVDSKETD